MANDFVSVWEIYGLNLDPFSTAPILVKGNLIPPEVFTGRINELKRLEKLFRSSGGSRSIVFGTQGVGKTTLVNIARINALEHNFFTPYQEIKVDINWSVDDFIVNTLSAIYSTLIKKPKQNEEYSKIISKLKLLFDLYEKREQGGSFEVGVLGTSIGAGLTKNTLINKPLISTTYLEELFKETVDSILNLGFREIIIHYNNLDNFDEEEEKIKILFNGVRDFTQTPFVHFVFIGSPTTASIITSIPRVSNIFNDTPMQLEPLSLPEIKKTICSRVKVSAIEGLKYFNPVTDESIETLYSLHNGNIRAIFNALSIAIREVTEEKPVSLTNELLKSVLYKIAKKRFIDKTTHTLKEVLIEMLHQEESSNKTISRSLDKQPQNVSKYLKDLKELQCIYLTRIESKEKYYAVSEGVKWLLLTDGEIDEEQDINAKQTTLKQH